MITVYCLHDNAVVARQPALDGPVPDGAVWIDVVAPEPEEKAWIEAAIGFEMPTPEEMREIEPSSRLYKEGDALFMTASVLYRTETAEPDTRVVTFVLTDGLMVSIRFVTPAPFETFCSRLQARPQLCGSAEAALVGLLDAIIDRIADALELVDVEVNALAKRILSSPDGAAPPSKDYEDELKAIGLNAIRGSRADESLVGFSRLLSFLDANLGTASRKQLRLRIKSLQRDAQSLSSYAERLSERLEFLLDATLGMINIRQTAIIKILSVAAAVFLPPTLIASIYGMNFRWMPELGWDFGYPFAIVLMIVSAVLPYLYFKRKGWL